MKLISTHWGRETHICVGKLTIIASDNGLSPGRRQAIIWTNAGILLIGPLGTNFNEILIEIHTFSFKKMHLKMSSAKWRPFCLGLNVLNSRVVINSVRDILTLFMWFSLQWITSMCAQIGKRYECSQPYFSRVKKWAEVGAWKSNYIHDFRWDMIAQLCLNFKEIYLNHPEVKEWVRNYITCICEYHSISLL